MIYVTMIDSFKSDWKYTEYKKSVKCIVCDTLEQAEEIYSCALAHAEISGINLSYDKPVSDDETMVSYTHYDNVKKSWKDV